MMLTRLVWHTHGVAGHVGSSLAVVLLALQGVRLVRLHGVYPLDLGPFDLSDINAAMEELAP